MSQVSAARYVPYAFARQHQVLVNGVTADEIEVWIGEHTPLHALAELSRALPARVIPVRKPAAELSAAISAAYAQQEGSAAAVGDEVECCLLDTSYAADELSLLYSVWCLVVTNNM